jgi:hypothetical protein
LIENAGIYFEIILRHSDQTIKGDAKILTEKTVQLSVSKRPFR